jgi:hypothetical protein
MSYHVDRFLAAVSVLAGHGHIKQRLIKAYEDNLVDINEDELPITLKEPFADLKQQMHRVSPLNGEGPICASVRKMSIDQASDCAATVVSLYDELARRSEHAEVTLPSEGQERLGVPPFLVKSN